MKKQFITGVLLLAVTAGGFSTFTSCKDTDEDLYNELNAQQVSLKHTIQQLQEQLNQCPTTCQTKIDALKAELQAAIEKKADKTYVDSLFNALKDELGKYATIEKLNEAIKAIEEKIDGIKSPDSQFTDEEIEALKSLAGVAAQLEDLIGEDGTVAELSKWFENIGIDVATFQANVKAGAFIVENKEALDALVALENEGLLSEEALQALKEYYANFEGINEMYEAIFAGVELPEGETAWWNYAEVMTRIKDLQDDIEKIVNRLNDTVTSLVLQASNNPIFGSINTPFGINSMVLMTCYGNLTTNVRQFPVSGVGAECYVDEDINWAAMSSDVYDLTSDKLVAVNENGEAALGNLWFTVNPGTVNNLDVNGFALVNSRDDEPVVMLSNVTKDDETVLKFGIGSRAAGNGNGLYRAEAVVDPANLDAIKVHIEPGLVESLKSAVKNRTASDMVQMLKAVYHQLQDICDANALRYSYESANKVDGQWITTPAKVYSNYGVAATAFKPLSYATLKGTSISKHLPTFGSIEISKELVDLNLKPFVIGDVTLDIDLKLSAIQIGDANETIITVKVPNKYIVEVDPTTGKGTATLPSGWDNDETGDFSTIDVDITGDLQAVINNVKNSIHTWIFGDDDTPGLEKEINDAVADAVNKAFNGPDGFIAKIEDQVNDMMGSIQDKLDSLVDQINSDYLGKVNSLINKYNTVAERINKVLDDPNHYLQSVMLYRKAGKFAMNGHTPEVELPFGILSTNPKQPTVFKGNGEAISLWATSYTFETVAPAFKKFVGVVSVKDQNGNDRPDLAKAANATLAKVMNGDQNRVALNVAGAKGGVFTYEIAYQALDYTGHTSTVKCYVQVVR